MCALVCSDSHRLAEVKLELDHARRDIGVRNVDAHDSLLHLLGHLQQETAYDTQSWSPEASPKTTSFSFFFHAPLQKIALTSLLFYHVGYHPHLL